MATSELHSRHTESDLKEVRELITTLGSIYDAMVRGGDHAVKVAAHQAWEKSVVNLRHYLELRRHDLRSCQPKLAHLGLSSLGRSEGHVIATFSAVMRTLHQLAHREFQERMSGSQMVRFGDGASLLESHTDALFGPSRPGHPVRIMVTMPEDAATDAKLVRSLVEAGMDCMRINCAHDDAASWKGMIDNLRAAERETGRTCKILMDLAGPKLRTGSIHALPVVKCRPKRDELGRVISPSRVWLFKSDYTGSLPDADAHLPLPAAFIEKLKPGDVLWFSDCRGARRSLNVVGIATSGRWAEATRTFYVRPGLKLHLSSTTHVLDTLTAEIGAAIPFEPFLTLRAGDPLVLMRSQDPGKPAELDAGGRVIQPARVPCTLPEVFDSVKPGEAIWFDDGKIGGVITEANADELRVKIQVLSGATAKLYSDKGINLPDSRLSLHALTESELAHLPFVAEHADLIGMSFIERAEDILDLQHRLHEMGHQPGIILKIETRRAFEALPELLQAAMHSSTAGVMIARGDLAVECGFERLAEVQEEILWICEAAHMPVVWATQVLESMAKSGRPSRSEVTDAAMGERAECVMLNKGPHILAAIRTLDEILQRMQSHQRKKSALLRELKSWGHLAVP